MKIKLILYIILICVSATGCWNKRELSELAIVQGIGIDKTSNNNYKLSYQLLKPSQATISGSKNEGSSQEKGVWVASSEGETLFEAIRNTTFESSRRLYFPHNKIIVISEDVAREGIKPITDFFARDPETRRLVFMFISHGKAIDIINASHPQENVPASAIENLAKTAYATSKIPTINFNDVLKNLASKTSNPIIPGIEIIKDSGINQNENRVKIKHTAIFKADKLIGWFNEEETRGLLWILGRIKSGIIVIPVENNSEHRKVSLEILKATSTLVPEIISENITMKVKIKVDSNIGEVMTDLNLNSPEIIKYLEDTQSTIIKKEIEKALSKAQDEFKVDVLEFGEAVHRENPENWKEIEENWQEIFPRIKVNIEVESKIRKKGMGTSN